MRYWKHSTSRTPKSIYGVIPSAEERDGSPSHYLRGGSVAVCAAQDDTLSYIPFFASNFSISSMTRFILRMVSSSG